MTPFCRFLWNFILIEGGLKYELEKWLLLAVSIERVLGKGALVLKRREIMKKNQVMWCRTSLQSSSQRSAVQHFNRLRQLSTVSNGRQLFLYEILVSAPLTTLYYSKVDLNTNLKTVYFSTSTAEILGKAA